MFSISKNGLITATRGDSYEFPIFINAGNAIERVRYNIQDNDTVYFALLEPNQKWEDAILKKIYTKDDCDEYGDIIVRFESADTERLLAGNYYYQVKLRTITVEGNKTIEDVSTVISKTKFTIIE